MKELVEYFWDENQEIAHFVYENDYTGEINQEQEYAPLIRHGDPAKPWWLEQHEDLRDKYNNELKVYLATQDPY